MSSVQSRNTKQRAAIRAVFESADRPMTTQDVLEDASADLDGLGLATVYRSVNALADEGWLEAVEIPNEPTRYEKSGKAHHHHFQCERCKRVYDIDGCIDNLRALIPAHFRMRSHALTLHGTCPHCNTGD